MPTDQWIALAVFAFVSSITPGPNNLMATASGARFGLRRTIPQVVGVTLGFTLLLLMAASGVAALMVESPALIEALAACGYLYLGWLSLRLLMTALRSGRSARQSIDVLRPLTIVQAAAFQFANPKGWMMAVSTATTFLAGNAASGWPLALLVSLLFALINFPCVGAWALLGSRMRQWLADPSAAWRLRVFNGTMAALLIGTIVWMMLRH